MPLYVRSAIWWMVFIITIVPAFVVYVLAAVFTKLAEWIDDLADVITQWAYWTDDGELRDD